MEVGRRRVQPTDEVAGDAIALCVIGRLENRYAVEFVEHYKALGFDRILLCDNNRAGEEYFEEVLQEYINDGFVRIFDYRGQSGVQRHAYADIYAKYGSKYQWIAFFDFDEFLVLNTCDNIHTLVENYAGYNCVLFNWMDYGDCGLVYDDGSGVKERFLEPLPFDMRVQNVDRPDNDHTKCMLRGGIRKVEFDETPHIPSSELRCCNASAERCHRSAFQHQDYSTAYLKHYCTKTAAEWFSVKWKKGTGNKPSMPEFYDKYAGRFFSYNEWTQEKEDVMRNLLGMPKYKKSKTMDVVIANFNTQRLTEAAIRSLNKHTQGCKIHVFDNSTREPFVNKFDNVDVIDNTRGQVVNFDAMLAEYPDKYPTPENNYGSAKHCKTIDVCFDLFPDGFMLMDSDVLVKQDISGLFDASCVWTGSIEAHGSRFSITLPRVVPFLCYINVPMCREHGIRYFHPQKMWALTRKYPDIAYDTGCWFYEACEKEQLPKNVVAINDYIIHFGHGSWCGKDESEWLDFHKDLWK